MKQQGQSTLDLLKAGEKALIKQLIGNDQLTCMLAQLGFIPGQQVSIISKGPFKTPTAVFIDGATFVLRKEQLCRIVI